MVDHLLERVQAFLTRHSLMQTERCLVVAVSGGPDSLCLLHLLWRLHQMGGPDLHVAHMDHGFRVAESIAEAEEVARLAAIWHLPATIERYDVPAIARTMRQNKQATARAVRYAFLAHVALIRQCAAVAVGHQADDQAETVLLHLIHGAGPTGLRGMRPVVPWDEWKAWLPATDQASQQDQRAKPYLIRPLLDTRREEIEAYCITHDLRPCRDLSNQSHQYTRNRIRADLLPHLETYNHQIVAALQRTAQICADDYAYIQEQLDLSWPDLVSRYPDMLRFSTRHWMHLPATLQRYALRRAGRYLVGSDALSFDQIEAGRLAATRQPGHQHALGMGMWLYVTDEHFLLINRPVTAADVAMLTEAAGLPQMDTEEITIALPGITPISATWQVETRSTPAEHAAVEQGGWRWSISLDADALDGPLWMRRRRAGDRFRPAGGVGSRSVQDYFVDTKLPRDLRTAWPILATATQIVWIAGMRADARFQVSPDTRRIVWVTLSKHTV